MTTASPTLSEPRTPGRSDASSRKRARAPSDASLTLTADTARPPPCLPPPCLPADTPHYRAESVPPPTDLSEDGPRGLRDDMWSECDLTTAMQGGFRTGLCAASDLLTSYVARLTDHTIRRRRRRRRRRQRPDTPSPTLPPGSDRGVERAGHAPSPPPDPRRRRSPRGESLAP